MVPNRVVLNVAIVPLREPDGVDLRARLRPGVTPLDIQQLLADDDRTPIRGEPRIILEEIDGDEVVVRIRATPEDSRDGPRLASEVLAADRPGDAPARARRRAPPHTRRPCRRRGRVRRARD